MIITEKLYKVRTAYELAWLKRPELGTTSTDVWELPDGGLIAVKRGILPTVTIFPGIKDAFK